MKLTWIKITRVTARPPELSCGRCNSEIVIPLSTPLGTPSEIVSAFMHEHRHCPEAAFSPLRHETVQVGRGYVRASMRRPPGSPAN
jgi:hypothetical protein